MDAFLLELGVILLLLGFLANVAGRLGLSAIPLFLLAGLLLGEGGVHDLGASTEFIEAAGELGVLLLLLMLGLEFSAAEFTASMRRHAPSGVVDLVLNAPVGFVAGLLLGYDWQGSLALAGVTWISSSGIVARLLSDLKRTGFRETPSVLSVLVLEDIAMAVFLPLLVVVLSGGTALTAVLAVGAALGLVLLVLLATRRLGHHLGKVIGHEDDEQVLLRVLGLMLVVAGLTYLVDASAAVGAFLVGLAIPGRTAKRARDVLRPLRDLFAALFFLSFGLQTSPMDLPPVLPAALVLAVVSAVTKVATGVYAAGRDGVGPRGRVRAGAALTARGEFSIVIAELAVVAGYTDIGPLASAYVVMLGVLGPLLSRFADDIAGPWARSVQVPAPSS
ncbi:MAG TPA: cation:proton antiporter [Nocardioidaceae bacterium]|nr:cation:proton antiporter [Nocardioidaceae bacterium]